jgi:cyclophilin family peptidyl-prolyl cis-trans isomerase/HEAT repeat protein
VAAAVIASTPVLRGAQQGAAQRAGTFSTADSALLQRILDAEDARASAAATLAPVHAALHNSNPAVRHVAVRALGRLEQASELGSVRAALDDPSAAVRAEAMNAAGQLRSGEAQRAGPAGARRDSLSRGVMTVLDFLRERAPSEADLHVREVMARTIGRLPYASLGDAREAANAMGQFTAMPLRGTESAWAYAPPFGVAHGLDALVRRFLAVRTAPAFMRAAAGSRSGAAADYQRGAADELRERDVIRTSIAGRLLATPAASAPALDSAAAAVVRAAFVADFAASDPQRRRQVIAMVPTAALDDSTRARLITAALRDTSATVRLEGVRAYARRRGASCLPLIAATRDANAHVALAAIDALGAACEGAGATAVRLEELVRAMPRGPVARSGARGSWHGGAHAAVSLARVSPEKARALLPGLLAHPVWQVRMYAARAAGALTDTAALVRLARDRDDNVRDAAITALAELVSPPARGSAASARSERMDSIFVAQLSRRDYQLVLSAARALEGAKGSPRMLDAVLAALDRITAAGRETSRDPRMELMARVQALGDARQAGRMSRYLADFDPAIAERAATVLRAWGDSDAVAAPRPLPRVPVSLAEVARVRDARVRITMAPESGGGSFEIRLFTDDAPATVGRFVSLVRSGYYDGLTFHRVAPNFVIQGGSPGANEYAGADRFMREELGLRSHARGTVGISTRGRDTGDAQFFVNLVDNWRLDHEYTVFGDVVRGMDVVDRILEGDVMRRVEIVGGR